MRDDARDDLVMDLVEAAMARPASERKTWLDARCAGDAELFGEVWDRIEWEMRMGGFLSEPVVAKPIPRHELLVPGGVLNGRFRLVRQVGTGKTSVVFEAIDSHSDARVAIKCPLPGCTLPDMPEIPAHPGICGVLGRHRAEVEEGPLEFLVLEFLAGETLQTCRGRLSRRQARDVARQLRSATEFARRHGVTAPGVSPRKVLVQEVPGGGLRAVIVGFTGDQPLPPPRPLKWLIALAAALAAGVAAFTFGTGPSTPPARLAILPPDFEAAGMLADLADRIDETAAGAAVYPLTDIAKLDGPSPEFAYSALHATHVLVLKKTGQGMASALVSEAATGHSVRDWEGRVEELPSHLYPLVGASLGARIAGPVSGPGWASYTQGLGRTAGDAIPLFESAARAEPGWVRPRSALAAARLAAGDLDGAVREAAEARRIDPNALSAVLVSARVAEAAGKPREAAAYYAQATVVAPHSQSAWRAMAAFHSRAPVGADAVADWNRATAVAPGFYPPSLELGRYLMSTGRFVEAESALRSAAEAAPGLVGALREWAQALRKIGRPEEADRTERRADALGAPRDLTPR